MDELMDECPDGQMEHGTWKEMTGHGMKYWKGNRTEWN